MYGLVMLDSVRQDAVEDPARRGKPVPVAAGRVYQRPARAARPAECGQVELESIEARCAHRCAGPWRHPEPEGENQSRAMHKFGRWRHRAGHVIWRSLGPRLLQIASCGRQANVAQVDAGATSLQDEAIVEGVAQCLELGDASSSTESRQSGGSQGGKTNPSRRCGREGESRACGGANSGAAPVGRGELGFSMCGFTTAFGQITRTTTSSSESPVVAEVRRAEVAGWWVVELGVARVVEGSAAVGAAVG